MDAVTPPKGPKREGSSLARLKLKKKPVVIGTKDESEQSDDTEINFATDTVDEDWTSPGESERDTVPTMETPKMSGDGKTGDVSGLLLGPAGTDPATARRSQFIGGDPRQADIEETLPGTPPPVRTPAPPVRTPAPPVRTPPPPTPGSVAAQPKGPEVAEADGLDAADLIEVDAEEMIELSPDELSPDELNVATTEMSKVDVVALLGSTEKDEAPDAPPAVANPVANFPPPVNELIVTPPPLDGASKAGLPAAVKYPVMAAVVIGFAYLTFSLLASDDGKKVKGVATAGAKDAAPSEPMSDAKAVTKVVPVTPVVPPGDAASTETPVQPTIPETGDAAVEEVVDASTDPVVPTVPTGNGDLKVGSQPAGAKVYLDGSLVGTTPVALESTADKHRLALVLPGYGLYTGEIDGKGFFNIDLTEVTPSDGPAGIKVRCKKTERYYVFVDDKATGQLCPTERIGVFKGKHVVEVYDPVTDTRREFNVDVVDTRLSVRVRVD
jgi:hypothetical protein